MHNDATLLLFHVQEMAKKVIDKRSFVHTYNQEYCLVAYSLYVLRVEEQTISCVQLTF